MHDLPIEMLERAIHVATATEACPYLPDRVATLSFGNGLLAGARYRDLLDAGYRRNGLYLYRPDCGACRACQVLRVPVAAFRRSKSQRRVWNRCCGEFGLAVTPASCTPEKTAVYARYLAHQHGDAQAEAGAARYEEFLVQSCLGESTFELQVRREGRLAAVGVLDRLGDALSSVYCYFDPDFAGYSLGTFTALCEIELARAWGLDYYYLGYYIAPCASMAYKAQFRPCEIKAPGEAGWRRLEA